MKIDLLKRLDIYIFSTALILVLIGILNLYSASRTEELSSAPVYIKQLYWLGIGLLAMAAAVVLNYRLFEKWAYIIYFINISLLVLLIYFGDRTGNVTRWFTFGPLSFQPSEFMKISLILAIGCYISRHIQTEGLRIRDLIIPSIMAVVPVLLIVMEPDLGSAGIMVLIFSTVIISIKMRPKTLISMILIVVLCLPPGLYFGWGFLKAYQKQRIVAFLNPELDPLGSGYHIIQSKIAVGSGKLFGKGYMGGTQSQLKFLPEQHTDFIFSVFAEEWGFIGSIILLGLFAFLILRGLFIAREARGSFGQIVALGISAMFLWQSFVNIGMATGIFPVVGIPLPFLSYGGSSLVTMLMGVGLLLNIHMRRYIF
jgi:rod shape determining protein RodA